MAEVLPSLGEDDPPEVDKIQDALTYLARTLEALDSAGAPPELAARVQEALDAIASYGAGS